MFRIPRAAEMHDKHGNAFGPDPALIASECIESYRRDRLANTAPKLCDSVRR